MARYLLASVLVLLAWSTGLTAYAAESASADRQAISAIEEGWNDAIKNKDKAWYAKNLSDDFVYISDEGKWSKGRAAFVDDSMKAPKSVEVSGTDENYQIHGTTGVVTGRLTVKYDNGTVSKTLYTDVYAKGADGWKCIASQETKAK